MAQPFSQQQIKTRTSVLVFLKGNAAPIVLYVENPTELYEELLSYLKMPTAIKLLEKERKYVMIIVFAKGTYMQIFLCMSFLVYKKLFCDIISPLNVFNF